MSERENKEGKWNTDTLSRFISGLIGIIIGMVACYQILTAQTSTLKKDLNADITKVNKKVDKVEEKLHDVDSDTKVIKQSLKDIEKSLVRIEKNQNEKK